MFGLITSLLGNKYLIGAIAAVALLCGAWFAGARHERLACEARANKAANEIEQAYASAADELRAGAVEREQRTKVIIKEVYREKDPTGCADMRGLDSVLDALRPSEN